MKTLLTFFVSALVLVLFSACADKPNYVHVEPEVHAIPSGGSSAMPEVINEDRSRGNLVIEENEDEKHADTGEFISKYHEKKKPKLIIYINLNISPILGAGSLQRLNRKPLLSQRMRASLSNITVIEKLFENQRLF